MTKSKILLKAGKLFVLVILLSVVSQNPWFRGSNAVFGFEPLFDTRIDYGAGNYPYSVFCADLDGDAYLDLAVANAESDNVSILKNNGDGTFQSAVNYGAGSYPVSVFCGDLDGDGDLDLAVANAGSGNVSIFKNNGDGTFQSAVNYGAGSYPVSVFCGDLDGDADLDLAVANGGSRNLSILKNNGDGTFQSAVNYGAGDYPSSVFCANLNGGSDLDLAVANPFGNNVSILFNRSIQSYVEEETDAQEVTSFFLLQNYPNPFNLSTKIEFALAKSGFVSLNIYDILGRKVRTLVSEGLSSGYKSVLWDGKNDGRKDVASGIYFYQLRIGDFSEAKKMLLLK